MLSIADFPKYESYIDSGVEWLRGIPASWSTVRMSFLFKDVSVKNRPSDTLLSVTQGQGVVPREWVESRMVMPSGNLESFKYIEKGDFAISLRSFEGGLEYCHHSGIISPAYTVLKAVRKELYEGYYKYLFKSQAFISELQTSIVGIREGKNISYEELKYSLLPTPQWVEQELIAKFLDKKTTQIEEAIAIKEQQIALLKERKQIIIQKAVTQGLDPNVPMKDSGVDWIGEIPAHWEVESNRSLFSERVEPGREGLPLLSVSIHSGVSTDEVSEEDNIRGRVKIQDKSKYVMVKKGDVAFNMMRAWQGGIGAVTTDGMVSPAYIVAQPKGTILAEFFEYQYRCPEFVQQMDRYSKGITDFRKRLYWDSFKQLKTVVPPESEQVDIIKYIQDATTATDSASDLLVAQIEKLKEYKTTLINSAVTGKIRITPDMLEA